MEGHAKKCVGSYCELTTKKDSAVVQSLYSILGRPYLQERRTGDGWRIVQSVLAHCVGRPDILWSVDKLARVVTKWTRACHKRLALLISYIHNTSGYRQYCHVGKTALHIGIVFRMLILLGILKTQKRPRGEFSVSLGVEHSFPQVGCARNKLQFHTVLLNLTLFLSMQVQFSRS